MSESGPVDWMNRLVKRWHESGAPPSELNEAVRIKQEIERLTTEVSELKDFIAASGGLKCRNCDDEGWYPMQVGDDEWEQVQCEFCYVVDDSIFNRKQKALAEDKI